MCERPTTARAFNCCPSGTAIQAVRYKLCQNSGRDYMCNFELKKKSYINMWPITSRYIITGILFSNTYPATLYRISSYEHSLILPPVKHYYCIILFWDAKNCAHTHGWRSSQIVNSVTQLKFGRCLMLS